MFSAGHKNIKVAREVNGKIVPLIIKESEKQPGDEDVSAFTQQELDKRLDEANKNRLRVKATPSGNSTTNAKTAWETEKSAIQKATKNGITDEDWDKPYSEVRKKLRGLGSTPTERENRWYKAHQLKAKAEVTGQIETPKTETPKIQDANSFTMSEIRTQYPTLKDKTDQQIIDAYKKQGITITADAPTP